MSSENAKQNIRILIVDNHPVLRTGLSLMLQYEPDMEAVAEASNGAEAVALFRQHLPVGFTPVAFGDVIGCGDGVVGAKKPLFGLLLFRHWLIFPPAERYHMSTVTGDG